MWAWCMTMYVITCSCILCCLSLDFLHVNSWFDIYTVFSSLRTHIEIMPFLFIMWHWKKHYTYCAAISLSCNSLYSYAVFYKINSKSHCFHPQTTIFRHCYCLWIQAYNKMSSSSQLSMHNVEQWVTHTKAESHCVVSGLQGWTLTNLDDTFLRSEGCKSTRG